MSDKTASMIRHLLTGIASVMLVLGLGKYTGVINYILDNMNDLIAALTSLSSIVVGIYGFFRGKK